MKYLKNFKVFVIFSLFILILTGCNGESVTLNPITLEYWGTVDNESAFAQILQDYSKTRPHITVNYTKFEPDVYEKELLNALAEDRGPDIYTLPYYDLKRFKDGLVFMPDTIAVAQLDQNGNPILQPRKSMSLRTARNVYLDQIYKNIILPETQQFDDLGNALPQEDKIYGLPLYADTLVLYYNKNLFENAAISNPPKTWTQFFEAVKLLTKTSENNRIVQSAAGFGTSNNVNHFFDIISLMMMQNGTRMIGNDGLTVTFPESPPGEFGETPALNAIQFFMDFALPYKESYTWNSKMQNSLEAFVQGRTAMYFGYARDYDLIKQKAPKLEFEISNFPQIQGNKVTNYLNFNVEVVSAKSAYSEQAWDFLEYISKPNELSKYLETVVLPTPIRALIVKQKETERLKVFAEQLLTSTNWYTGYDYDKTTQIFDQLIKDFHIGKYESMQEGLNQAAYEVSETMYPPAPEQ